MMLLGTGLKTSVELTTCRAEMTEPRVFHGNSSVINSGNNVINSDNSSIINSDSTKCRFSAGLLAFNILLHFSLSLCPL